MFGDLIRFINISEGTKSTKRPFYKNFIDFMNYMKKIQLELIIDASGEVEDLSIDEEIKTDIEKR